MSRPISIEELVKIEKPKFVKRSNRSNKKDAQVISKKRSAVKVLYEPEDEIKEVKKPKSNKQTKQFDFNWSDAKDSSEGYNPVVEIDTFEDDLGAVSGTHWSQKPLPQMSSSDWRDMKDEFNIIVKGSKIKPIRSWNESDINPSIVAVLHSLRLEDPTPIQRASVPIALNKQDILGIAETGSGKTLAYVIPLINYILSIDENYLKFDHMEERNLNKPLGLILAPTRELANQITTELNKFCTKLKLNCVSIIGGHSYEETVNSIKNGVHIVVATPGRLEDSLERKMISLSRCYYVIFDEADRMIDMGFEKSLTAVYDSLIDPTEQEMSIFHLNRRVTAMFTATFSDSITSLTKQYLYKPAQLVIGQIGEKVDNITQEFEFLQPRALDKKFEKLLNVINMNSRSRDYSIIIFANFIKTVEEISEQLMAKGYDNIAIHGSKSQQARERSIDEFKSGRKRILIATDVAARGLDIANVSLVINYQMTKKLDEYIHRIGRTGRAGSKGKSYTFIDQGDEGIFTDLRRFLKKNVPSWLANYQNQLIKD